jgi:hypothetical protein
MSRKIAIGLVAAVICHPIAMDKYGRQHIRVIGREKVFTSRWLPTRTILPQSKELELRTYATALIAEFAKMPSTDKPDFVRFSDIATIEGAGGRLTTSACFSRCSREDRDDRKCSE